MNIYPVMHMINVILRSRLFNQDCYLKTATIDEAITRYGIQHEYDTVIYCKHLAIINVQKRPPIAIGR